LPFRVLVALNLIFHLYTQLKSEQPFYLNEKHLPFLPPWTEKREMP